MSSDPMGFSISAQLLPASSPLVEARDRRQLEKVKSGLIVSAIAKGQESSRSGVRFRARLYLRAGDEDRLYEAAGGWRQMDHYWTAFAK